MTFKNDTRGVSEVVGAILVFGVLVALLAVMQTQAIPAANEQVEYNHNQEVQSDLVGFHEASSSVSRTGEPQTVKIQMGTTYPSRLLFFNPRNPSGTIRTTERQTASIQNVRATDQTARKYIDGSLTGLETKRLEYKPNYNEYQNSPTTVVEYGAVYRDFGDEVVIDDEADVINGNTISLRFFAGNLSRTQGGARSVEAYPTSAPTQTVTVEPTASVMTLRIPTRLNASDWDEMIGNEENVEDIRDSGDFVEIDLNGTKTYNLRMAQIGVGNSIPTPEPAYTAKSSGQQLQIGEPNILPVQVRDKYNNPVSGESINLSVDTGQFQNGAQTIESNTTEDGKPAARYFGSGAGVVQVEASYARQPSSPNFDPANNPEDIRFNVSFNPRLDTIDPSFNSHSVSTESYSVCTAFSNSGVLDPSLLACSTTSQATQIAISYDVEDDGGAGLDYIEVGVTNSTGGTIMNATHNLVGAQDDGTFYTPQMIHDQTGEPVQVEIRVYDRNGNSVNRTEAI